MRVDLRPAAGAVGRRRPADRGERSREHGRLGLGLLDRRIGRAEEPGVRLGVGLGPPEVARVRLVPELVVEDAARRVAGGEVSGEARVVGGIDAARLAAGLRPVGREADDQQHPEVALAGGPRRRGRGRPTRGHRARARRRPISRRSGSSGRRAPDSRRAPARAPPARRTRSPRRPRSRTGRPARQSRRTPQAALDGEDGRERPEPVARRSAARQELVAQAVEAAAHAPVDPHRAGLEDEAADQVGVDLARRLDLPSGGLLDLADDLGRLLVRELDRGGQLDARAPAPPRPGGAPTRRGSRGARRCGSSPPRARRSGGSSRPPRREPTRGRRPSRPRRPAGFAGARRARARPRARPRAPRTGRAPVRGLPFSFAAWSRASA